MELQMKGLVDVKDTDVGQQQQWVLFLVGTNLLRNLQSISKLIGTPTVCA